MCDIFLSFYNFILGPYWAEKFLKHLHEYFHMSFVSIHRGTSKKKTQKNIHGRKAKMFCLLKNKFSSFVCSQSGTYYALFLGFFEMKFLPDIPLIVCIELWLTFQPQCSSTRFAIYFWFSIPRTEGKVHFCVKLVESSMIKALKNPNPSVWWKAVLKMVAAPSRLCLMKTYMLCLMKTFMYISCVLLLCFKYVLVSA